MLQHKGNNSLHMRRLCALLVGWVVGLALAAPTHAQDAMCEEPGFYSVLCGPYQVKKEQHADRTRETTLVSPMGAQVIYQVIPFAYFPDQRGSLKQVIDYYRQKLTQAKGSAPQEKWYVHQGSVRFYQLYFPPNVGLWMTSTAGGYLAIFATWKDPKDPLMQHIDTTRYAARPINETIAPPSAPPSNAVGQGQWFCKAQGVVQHCRKNRGSYYTPCTSLTAFGGGIGTTREAAASAALQKCMMNRTNSFIQGNFPSGSSHYYNFSRYGAPCMVTHCSLSR